MALDIVCDECMTILSLRRKGENDHALTGRLLTDVPGLRGRDDLILALVEFTATGADAGEGPEQGGLVWRFRRLPHDSDGQRPIALTLGPRVEATVSMPSPPVEDEPALAADASAQSPLLSACPDPAAAPLPTVPDDPDAWPDDPPLPGRE